VQLAAQGLWSAAVGDVADQDVMEAQLILTGQRAAVKLNQPATDQRA
jgi:hypothetical protein